MASYRRTQRRSDASNSAIDLVSYEEESEENDGFDGVGLEDLTPNAIANNVRDWTGNGPDQDIAKELFAEAKLLFDRAVAEYERDPNSTENQSRFSDAGETFFDAAKRWPDSALEQEALYLSGEAYFFADMYEKSNRSFEMLLAEYPGTRYLDLAQARRFAIAQYWIDLTRFDSEPLWEVNLQDGRRPMHDTRGHGVRIFDRIRRDDPTGRLADDATMALANAYFAEARFMDAADTYEDLRRHFPTSPHQYDAHLLELRSRLQAYQGADYDGTHLRKADALLNSIVKQFPTEMERERDELASIASEVRFRLAEQEMRLARYYDYSGLYQAATIYYQEVADKFEGTPQAEEAVGRIQEIATKPAKPKQRAGWLVRWFPSSDDSKPLIPTSPTTSALR